MDGSEQTGSAAPERGPPPAPSEALVAELATLEAMLPPEPGPAQPPPEDPPEPPTPGPPPDDAGGGGG